MIAISHTITAGPNGKSLADEAKAAAADAQTAAEQAQDAANTAQDVGGTSAPASTYITAAQAGCRSAQANASSAAALVQSIHDIGYAPFWKAPLNCFPECSWTKGFDASISCPICNEILFSLHRLGRCRGIRHHTWFELLHSQWIFSYSRVIQPVVLSSWCQAADRQEYTSMGQTNIKTHVLI